MSHAWKQIGAWSPLSRCWPFDEIWAPTEEDDDVPVTRWGRLKSAVNSQAVISTVGESRGRRHERSDSPATQTARFRATLVVADASDEVGVTRVEFYVDGTLKCSVTAAPYSCAWRVLGTRNRNYQLWARAYDAVGNVGRSAVVTVTSQ